MKEKPCECKWNVRAGANRTGSLPLEHFQDELVLGNVLGMASPGDFINYA